MRPLPSIPTNAPRGRLFNRILSDLPPTTIFPKDVIRSRRQDGRPTGGRRLELWLRKLKSLSRSRPASPEAILESSWAWGNLFIVQANGAGSQRPSAVILERGNHSLDATIFRIAEARETFPIPSRTPLRFASPHRRPPQLSPLCRKCGRGQMAGGGNLGGDGFENSAS